MNKILLYLVIGLLAISMVLAQGKGSNDNQQGATDDQGNGESSGEGQNTEVQNQGDDNQIQEQVQDGESEQVMAQNKVELKAGNMQVKGMQVMSQGNQMMVQLSNGKNAEVKVMPETASEKARERLQLNMCSEENECQIELKEVGDGEQTRAAYEIQAKKEVKFMGMFRTQMKVQAQIDAENGEIIQSKKPWWAFLASE